MEGHSHISPDVLARYAADAAAEVRGRAHQAAPRRKIDGSEVEVHVVIDYGANVPTVAGQVQRRVTDYLEQMADVAPDAVMSSSTTCRGESAVPPRLAGLTKLTLETAPTVCHDCIWWQTRGRRPIDKDRWMEKVEVDFGAFGTVYYDGDGRCSARCSTARRRVSARVRAAGRPAVRRRDLVTCAYLVDESSPWVLQSLFLAAIGEARDRGARALEAFSYRYPEGESAYERFRCTRRCSRSRSSPTSASRCFVRPAASGSRGSSSAACNRSSKASARRCCASSRTRSVYPNRSPSRAGPEPSQRVDQRLVRVEPVAARNRQPADLEDQRHVDRRERCEVDLSLGRVGGGGSSRAAACRRRGQG